MSSIPQGRLGASARALNSQATPGRAGAGSTPAGKQWLLTVAVMSGTFLAVMDVSVVNVSLPHMMGHFGQTLSAITWVATSYGIAEILSITMAGWWSALLGRKRLYLASFALFTLGSMLAGTAQTFPQMLLYRAFQGLAGGILTPVSQAILRETFPPRQQAMAMAIFGMGVVLAPAMGPILGGWLTDTYGWPWIFYINVPVSIVGMLMVSAFVEDPPYLRRGIAQVDWVGIALLTGGLTGMQIVLERGHEHNWFASRWITAGAILTLSTLMSLVFWELRTREPIVNVRVLRNIPLSVGSGVGFLFGIAFFGTTFSLPQLTQHLLHYSAYQAGLVLFPRMITLFLAMPLVGWLFNYVDPRLLIGVGIGTTYWSFQQLAHLSLDVGFWNLVPILLVMGVGLPCIFVPLSTVSLSTIRREDMTAATSLYTLARRVGGNIGYALVATLVDRLSAVHRVHLIKHISALNTAYLGYQAHLTARLVQGGGDPVAAQHRALALVNTEVNRQATILAYNNIAGIFGTMFLGTLPFLFLVSRRKAAQPATKTTEH
ncbi:MAG: DHA2 family efflux MFS transporter permease subunit [Nitrospinae bacterium]|nr:DHA2 family efflux MFS transporter permease subunit [Nitrospinota bacterium]